MEKQINFDWTRRFGELSFINSRIFIRLQINCIGCVISLKLMIFDICWGVNELREFYLLKNLKNFHFNTFPCFVCKSLAKILTAQRHRPYLCIKPQIVYFDKLSFMLLYSAVHTINVTRYIQVAFISVIASYNFMIDKDEFYFNLKRK